jgi:glycolate oxidase FAD binding subunit
MSETLKPTDAAEVLQAVQWAVASGRPLEVLGRGSKRGFGRPGGAAVGLDLSRLSGIGRYEPNELYMTTGASTPMTEIEAALRQNNQQMAFEPADLGPLLGSGEESGSIGGAIACNLAGPRRIKVGAARDHFLGFHAVSGRGEVFKSGGTVVKNVTGFDLSKLLAGSFGTLAVMTEVTFKVLPAPEKTRTVLALGLADADAVNVLSKALGSAHEVSAAAHLPVAAAKRSKVSYVANAGQAVTAMRVEGPGPSVEHRCNALREILKGKAETEELHSENSATLWCEVRDVALLADGPNETRQVWRLSVPPTTGARLVAALAGNLGGEAIYDWGGGLVWLSMPARPDAGHAQMRAAVAAAGGHATLLRASADVRAQVPVFQPPQDRLMSLTARVKEAFDPKGVLNPGRMYEGV